MSAKKQLLEVFALAGEKVPPVFVEGVAGTLRGTGLKVTAKQIAGASAVFLGVGAVLGILSGSLLIAGLMGALGAMGPFFACKAGIGMRQGKVARQIEQNGEEMATQVQAGTPFVESLQKAAHELPMPLREELTCVLAEHGLGLSLPEAWKRFARRVRTSEVVQIGDIFSKHLAGAGDVLNDFRQINFKAPYQIPFEPPPGPPANWEESVFQLHCRYLDQLDLLTNPGVLRFEPETARKALQGLKLPQTVAGREEQLVEALRWEVEGRGPLEALLGSSAIQGVYVVSPTDVFAMPLPPELVDSAPPEGAMAAPEGFQRSNVRLRDAAHMQLVLGRILGPLGQTLSKENPSVEGQLPDGWTVAAQLQEAGTAILAFGRE